MKLDTIITGDSAVVLQDFEPDCIDLTVTSPPYDNLRTYNGFVFDFETIAKQLFRVTKVGGVVVWVVGDATVKGSETGTSFRQALFFKECSFNLHDTMIYKTNKPPMNARRYQSEFEYMFILSKGTPSKFNPILVPSLHPNVRHTGGHRTKDGKKTTHERKQDRTAEFKVSGNIWYFPRSSKSGDEFSREHPATFPEALANDHILSWSNAGDTVLDCCCGSGTTPKMAKLLNRHYIGIDISAEYVALASERLAQLERDLTPLALDGATAPITSDDESLTRAAADV